MANNSDTADTEATGNTRKRSRHWAFTVNNPPKYLDTKIAREIKIRDGVYIIGHEVGEKGTPHLQGYCSFFNAISFNTMKSIMPTAHIEKARCHAKTNYEYCRKDGNFITNMIFEESLQEKLLNQYNGVVWKDWQQQILDVINSPRENRKIYWVNDSIGNSGKSFLCKFIFLTYGCIIADGKKDNVFNQLLTWMSDHKNEESPQVIILDVPRHSFDYINYGMLEQLKNGLVYSGKYEGGVCAFEPPHVIVLANQKPDTKKWSKDRLVLIDLDDKLGMTVTSPPTESQDSVSDSSEANSCDLGFPK